MVSTLLALVKNFMSFVSSISKYFCSISSVATITLKLGISLSYPLILFKWYSTFSSTSTGWGYFLSICFFNSISYRLNSMMCLDVSSSIFCWRSWRSSSSEQKISLLWRPSWKLFTNSSIDYESDIVGKGPSYKLDLAWLILLKENSLRFFDFTLMQ